MNFNNDDKIVLIGDSITDAGRREDPEKMGHGYVRLIRDYYSITEPEANLQFLNKGIGGDRVDHLAARWQEDVIDLQPDWVSISIGINDVWRQLDNPHLEQIYPEKYEQIYSELLSKLSAEMKTGIILMEPTVIEEDLDSKGNLLLIPYIEAVHRLAVEYKAIVVPTHQAFKTYLRHKSGFKLTTDGVHMTSGGDLLMAQTWIKAVQEAEK
ncbi:SGNH/GDSL hydrolase family protein [Bacillus sp. FSL K6-3431]|uniref:SGNH/GDSL hydrolase family protein n=1 Tax=Bacillus sp. FSL K6-3431 TaxID=2921500 RepID=UPI0030F90971